MTRGVDIRPRFMIAPLFRALSFGIGSLVAVLLLFFFDKLLPKPLSDDD